VSKLSRLQARLVVVQARIAELVALYPILAKFKSYGKGFGEVTTSYQEFGPFAREYERLTEQEDALEDEIAQLDDGEGGSAFASFRGVT